MKKKILALALALGVLAPVIVPSGEVSAAKVSSGVTAETEELRVLAEGEVPGVPNTACDTELLGLRPWYYGLTDDNCNIVLDTGCQKGEVCGDVSGASNNIAKFIWVIILNVLVDLFMIGGMVAVGFLIYGGYLYLRSGGDPNFAAKGKKTITAALVGLVIVTLANVISRLIVTVLTAE